MFIVLLLLLKNLFWISKLCVRYAKKMMCLLVNKIISSLPWQGMNYGLKHLDLSWNCIRFKGAVGMAQGLKVSLS